MRKKILAFVFAAALLVAIAVPLFGGVGTASAQVHGVSQAGCSGQSSAGANESSSNTPGGPIPVSASGAPLPNNGGGDGDVACDVLP